MGFFIALKASTQDIIVKNDKTEIKAKVLEITESTIMYKKFEMLDGPSYSIKKTEVFVIIYQNGTKEYMVNSTPKLTPQTVVKTTTNEVKQSSSGGKAKGKATMGLNIAVLSTNASIDFVPNTSAVVRGKAGVYLTKQLSNNFTFQPALNIVSKGTSFSYTDFVNYYEETINIYLAEIPLTLLYTTGETKGLQLGIAPTLGFKIAATEVGTSRPVGGSFTTSFNNTPDLSSFELSNSFLVGYKFSPKFAITLLYNTGLSNLSNTIGSYKTNYFGIQTSFGF